MFISALPANGTCTVELTACAYDMRVADKRVTATKNVPFGAILTVCMILLVCDGCRLGQQEPEGGLTDLQLFSQAPIFTFAETQQPNQRKRAS